ncbi:hypothetical protein AAVH_20030 [Aphelenchoides avenae]|nr:hypothetical protein AAVH_20030 [Aphelenchus avenae]
MVTYLFLRVPIFGFFHEFYQSCYLCKKLVYDGTCYFAYFQVMCHTVIAFNRFTVFFHPMLHKRLWNMKVLRFILLALMLAPLPAIARQLPVSLTYAFFDDSRVSITYDDLAVQRLVVIIGASIYMPCSLLALVLNLCAIVKYRMLKKANVVHITESQDIRLLGSFQDF